MPILVYCPELFPLLQQLANVRGSDCGLLHQPFVDHYYTNRNACKLYLVISEHGDLLGTLGMEALQFECGERILTIHAGSNYYSLRPGGASAITRRIIRSTDLLATYGGSEDTHRILQRLKYCCYFTGLKTYFLNYYHWLDSHVGCLRKARNYALRLGTGRTLSSCAGQLPRAAYQVQIREEKCITAAMLPRKTPFRFRLHPGLEFLNWRFNTSLPFVSYRVFRIFREGCSSGYVVLNDSGPCVIVSHCDGTDAQTLAHGTLLSLLALGRNTEKLPVTLSCAHPLMTSIYEQFGFKSHPGRPFSLYSALRSLPALPECSDWLATYELGDNGLRPPFLDRQTCEIIAADDLASSSIQPGHLL